MSRPPKKPSRSIAAAKPVVGSGAAKVAATKEKPRPASVSLTSGGVSAGGIKSKANIVPDRQVLDDVAELTAADLVPVDAELAKSGLAKTPSELAVSAEKIAEPELAVAEQSTEAADQKGTVVMVDVIETTKKYTDEAKTRFESAFTDISQKAKVGVEKSTKAFEELSDIAKGNVEAFVESGKIATKGIETLGQDAAEYGRVSFEKASAALKNLAAVKSPAEFFQLQSELLSSSFDAFAKETAKNSEALLKLAGDVVQPISTRVSHVTEKVRTIAA
jgi:phasin family protein